jgi:hypothetical protein
MWHRSLYIFQGHSQRIACTRGSIRSISKSSALTVVISLDRSSSRFLTLRHESKRRAAGRAWRADTRATRKSWVSVYTLETVFNGKYATIPSVPIWPSTRVVSGMPTSSYVELRKTQKPFNPVPINLDCMICDRDCVDILEEHISRGYLVKALSSQTQSLRVLCDSGRVRETKGDEIRCVM